MGIMSVQGANSGGFSRSDLVAAIKRADTHAVRAMIEAGVDVNEPDGAGVTPLMVAVRHVSEYEIIWLLVDNGAKVAVRDRSGRSAIDRIEVPPEPPEHFENAHEAWTHSDEAFVIGHLMEAQRRELSAAGGDHDRG